MNNGTIIRTILVVATCLNTALMATDVAQFGNEKVNFVYRVISVVLNFIIVACATYYNNDYTEAAAAGTGYTRQLKAEQKAGYVGDYFYTNEDDEDPADLEEEVAIEPTEDDEDDEEAGELNE